MDIVEFAEKFYDAKLPEWQKNYLRTLDEVCKNGSVRIVIPKDHGRFYTYFKFKELFPYGPQNDRKQ